MGDTHAEKAVDLTRLREDLCSDMVKLQELIMKADTDSSGVLDKFAMLAAVNQCTGICKRTAAVEVALECADTTGTGTMININVAMQRMCEELVRDVDREHMEGAQEALRDKRTRLVEQTEAEGSEGFIEAKKLREVLTAGEFGLAGDVVSSIMRFFGVRDEGSDSVRIPEITRSLCPSLDQIIFAGLNSKVMAKYGSLKTGFDALSKGGKISRQQLSELLQELDSQMRRSDVDELVRLADADGSGSIEYQEFQIIFGTGEVVARTRQANFKKLQDKVGILAMRSFCPELDDNLFAAINTRIVAKYGSFKQAFDALAKGGKIGLQKLSGVFLEVSSYLSSLLEELVAIVTVLH